ncbi:MULTISPECIES: RNA polymerase sigma factor [Pseudoalteromonas]|jgi:RNA polymerase sigma-70 factor (ECF subfamily)|uniref:RNA polymerase sigma factor n=1 Tax=Pseudoalteromonas TaxID=53246 RepID=UPI0002318396|nr:MULTISPECIES: sigma-70 family RNA polymerase sigma factor [Pseudoalteromonas]MDP2487032.1 sigma-70 family RNA polymerase sigma factor [Pseudoalteromonas marina]UOB73009.1 sigma-70 family RNA polymerase sigma factor [Pseudoalteromonas sp. APM04]BBW92546.1 RNA polymerase subunit sigma-24 [Pseudoalteromonas sp. PS1M3]GAA76689.1 RNA polymerase sigma-70 factor, ECF subfamily [Pseudoalteromonas sp. BSi20480]
MLHVKPDQPAECENALIERVKSGDQSAYTMLYQLHIKRVYGLCLRLLADQSHAEDAAQEVFVQVWHKIAMFDGRSQFSTWLYSVASNIAINYLRKQKSWVQKVVSIEQDGMDEQSAKDCKGLNGLDKLIVRLPERARMVFVLFAVEGYRHEEIAEQLGIAVGSSKSQYHRARQLLQEWYENE